MVLTRLNLETRIHHADVDAQQLAILAKPDVAAYRAALIRAYGFEAAVESALSIGPPLPGIELRERAKAGLIAGDLLALGLRPQELAKLPLCPRLESVDSIEDALGWLYVVERKTLLNAVLVRKLAVDLPDPITHAGAYLQCYAGGTAAARWRELGLAYDRIVTPDLERGVIAAAHHAFWCERDWFQRAPGHAS